MKCKFVLVGCELKLFKYNKHFISLLITFRQKYMLFEIGKNTRKQLCTWLYFLWSNTAKALQIAMTNPNLREQQSKGHFLTFSKCLVSKHRDFWSCWRWSCLIWVSAKTKDFCLFFFNGSNWTVQIKIQWINFYKSHFLMRAHMHIHTCTFSLHISNWAKTEMLNCPRERFDPMTKAVGLFWSLKLSHWQELVFCHRFKFKIFLFG